MEYLVETWTPQHASRLVDAADLVEVYERLRGDDSPTVTWNDQGDQVLIVSVEQDTATVSLLHDFTWYYLEISPDQELVEVNMGGDQAFVPRGVMVPRNLALEVLLGANDIPRLLTDYSWREQ